MTAFATGNKFLREGKLEEAIASYEKAIEANPQFASSYQNLGEALEKVGRIEEAIAAFRQVVAINPQSPWSLYKLGVMLSQQGEVQEGVDYLRRAINLKKDVPEFYLGLGTGLVKLGQWSEAVDCLNKVTVGTLHATSLPPTPYSPLPTPYLAEAYFYLAEAKSGQQQWSEAMEFYQRSWEVNPGRVECCLGLVKALGKLGRWSEAVELYRRVVVLSGESGEVLFGLGQALAQLGRWDEAVGEYQKAIGLGFAGAEVRHHLGFAHAQLGRWEEAVVEYRLVVEVNPKSATVRHQLGYGLMRLERWREAEVELRRSLEFYSGSAVVWQQLGDVLRELGKRDELSKLKAELLEVKKDAVTTYKIETSSAAHTAKFVPQQKVSLLKRESDPLVGIITRTKNRNILLKRAVESINSQTFNDYVWVIVNDGGNPELVENTITKSGFDLSKVQIIHNPTSQGMEKASNIGIKASQSKYLVIHDDDDSWSPSFLQETLSYLEGKQSEKIKGVIVHTNKIDEVIADDDSVKNISQKPYKDWVRSVSLSEILSANMFPPISFVYERKALETVGFYDESLPVLGDWDFNIRFLRHFDIGVIQKKLANYHHRTANFKSDYGNSLYSSIDKHIFFENLVKNRYLGISESLTKVNGRLTTLARDKKENIKLPDVIIGILTCQKYKHKQQAIRDTWLQEVIKHNIPYFFIIGRPSSRTYVDGDILYVDAPDSYEHLPRKVYKFFEFVYNHTSYSHAFKIDDDCYLNVPAFLKCGFENVDYMGKIAGADDNLDRGWHIGKCDDSDIGEYTGNYHGNWANGAAGYFLSRNAMKNLVEYPHVEHTALELYEDKMMGDILRKSNIKVSTSKGYIIGAERQDKLTNHKLGFAPWSEAPYPHKNNDVVVFHSDAAPEILYQIHRNYYNENYKNREFLRHPNWERGWPNNLVCLERMDSKEVSTSSTDILCFVVVRNEYLRLAYLLSYYREKGISKFFVVDNHSTDETLEYLLEQPDVYVWHTTRSYGQAKWGVEWVELLLKNYGIDRWCLLVDADEVLYYPDCEFKSIPQLCQELESKNKQAFTTILLDMYSDKPIKDTVYQRGQNFLEVCSYFDKDFHHFYGEKAGPHGNQKGYWGGLRQRIFGNMNAADGSKQYCLNKVPLIKYNSNVKLYEGFHWIDGVEVAEETGCLLHFKYFSTFHDYAKQEIERKEHWNSASEYAMYVQKLDENQELSFYAPNVSVRLEGSQQLVNLGIMTDVEKSYDDIPIIIDVGANNGNDCDFYLRKGFKVVAIEADPELADNIREKFKDFVVTGQLVVKNVAVTDAKKTVKFYKNSFSEWSSLNYDSKATKLNTHEIVEVEGDTLLSIIEEFKNQEIYYLKLDIEGGELDAVRSLVGTIVKPKYVSFEVNSDWKEILNLLNEYGYCNYKLIRQGEKFLQPPPYPPLEGNYVGCSFINSMSGTFGRETPGEWKSYEKLRSEVGIVEEQRKSTSSTGKGFYLGNQPTGSWYDIHATVKTDDDPIESSI